MKTIFPTLISLFFTFSLFSQSLEDGLVAQYTFDKADYQNQKVIDITDNSNDITCNDFSFFDDDVTGNSDAAMATAYPVPEAYMELNENQDLVLINELNDFTISFWTIQGSLSATSGFSPILNIEGESENVFNLEMDRVTKQIHFTNSVNEVPIGIIKNAGNQDGWYHVAILVNSTQNKMELYIDGEFIGETVLGNFLAPTNPVITFGKYRNGEYASATTCFDQMFIHDRVLSKEEVELARNSLFTTSENNILPAEDLKIYPNPVKNISTLNIDFPNATSKALVEIYDVQGRILRIENINNKQINVANLSQGLYFIKVKTTEGVYLKKLIIE